MSKLNANAYSFVPGQSFRLPGQQSSQSSPAPTAPLERAPQTEAPPPPPTISLNIGGSKPAPLPPSKPAPPPASQPAPPPEPSKPAAPASSIPASVKASTPAKSSSQPSSRSESPAPTAAPSKTFTLEKAKTDTAAIAQEVQRVADENTLKDLFGHGKLQTSTRENMPDEDRSAKEHLNIVFVGHVDAGKSTMGGNLLYITGMVDKRTMEKYEREAKEAGRDSWYLSWALDSTPQERAKGKTVEVGRGYFETNTRRYTILDAPGHKTFVPSMISGAAQADVAILVISARKGEFETGFEKGGQTREHIMLVKTAGVSKVVCVINKMDESTVEWSKARFDEIKEKLTPFIKAAGSTSKQTGDSLLEHLDTMPMVNRKINAPLMMPVSEKYKDMGTIAVGKIESGHMRKGDSLMLMPNKDIVEISAIYNEMEEEVPTAMCGDNVRIRLRGVEDDDISPGFVLSTPSKPVHAVRQFEAQLAILDHKNIICAGYTAVMHIHTLAEDVTLSALLHYFDKATGRKSRKPPQFAKKGQKIVALIETVQPVCVERFVDYPQLGRFTLRDEGKTVAIGKITKLIEGLPEEVVDGVGNLTVAA
ncbi:eukaryotic polypeptide chain release factor 3 [Fomitopsis serialis]|uniref:eukaryotic polypeptide chain release factor 3 n=1 Tax=Fomitopsis serialis TaxID=139415 RepID=UPI002007958A|nr:eukaryotic polypeptide chain release factor 3 [Neoantrodia serialis]KAH9938302.1 eukaryotic polypeptide chain release factor 3 [Neoantrodia serialis]